MFICAKKLPSHKTPGGGEVNGRLNPRTVKILLLVSGLFLCLGVLPVWPQGFYFLMRLAVCSAAVYAALHVRTEPEAKVHFFFLVFLAVLFNPVMPVIPSREMGYVIDLGTAVYFLNLAKKIKGS